MTWTRWKRRWLIVTIYKPPSLSCNCFLQILSLFSATECCKNYAPGIQSVTSDYSIGMFQGGIPPELLSPPGNFANDGMWESENILKLHLVFSVLPYQSRTEAIRT